MNFLKTSFYSAISTGISLITRLVTNKIVAVYLGTEGMFLLGQLKDLLRFSEVAGTLGTTKGTLAYTAKYKDDPFSFKKLLGTSFRIHLVFSVIICAIIFLFSDSISNYLFQTDEFSTALMVVAFSIITMSFHVMIMTVLNGLKQIKTYVLIVIISTVLSAMIMIGLIIKFGIIGAFYGMAASQILSFLLSVSIILVYRPFSIQYFFTGWYKPIFSKLSRFSAMSLAGPLFLIATTIFVRLFLTETFDEQHAGSWEGMWRISALYLMFLTTTFNFYIIPTFAEMEGSRLRKEVFNVWKITFPAIILIAAVTYALKDFIINLLLDKEFFLVGVLMGFHLLGDIFKINGAILGNILVAKAKAKVFILFQIEWAVVFILSVLFFVNQLGFIGVSVAYFVSYIIHFLAMNIYFRSLLYSTHKNL